MARKKLVRRVRIVCDGCGEDRTEVIVEGLATANDKTVDEVHDTLWADVGRAAGKRVILLEGAHAERIIAP